MLRGIYRIIDDTNNPLIVCTNCLQNESSIRFLFGFLVNFVNEDGSLGPLADDGYNDWDDKANDEFPILYERLQNLKKIAILSAGMISSLVGSVDGS